MGFRALGIRRRKLAYPGEDERDGKSNRQKNKDERHAPLRQAESRRDVVDELQQPPGHDGVSRGHPVDVPALQLRQEIGHALSPLSMAGLEPATAYNRR